MFRQMILVTRNQLVRCLVRQFMTQFIIYKGADLLKAYMDWLNFLLNRDNKKTMKGLKPGFLILSK